MVMSNKLARKLSVGKGWSVVLARRRKLLSKVNAIQLSHPTQTSEAFQQEDGPTLILDFARKVGTVVCLLTTYKPSYFPLCPRCLRRNATLLDSVPLSGSQINFVFHQRYSDSIFRVPGRRFISFFTMVATVGKPGEEV